MAGSSTWPGSPALNRTVPPSSSPAAATVTAANRIVRAEPLFASTQRSRALPSTISDLARTMVLCRQADGSAVNRALRSVMETVASSEAGTTTSPVRLPGNGASALGAHEADSLAAGGAGAIRRPSPRTPTTPARG